MMKKEFPPPACKCSLTICAGCRSGKACGESYRLVCRVSYRLIASCRVFEDLVHEVLVLQSW